MSCGIAQKRVLFDLRGVKNENDGKGGVYIQRLTTYQIMILWRHFINGGCNGGNTLGGKYSTKASFLEFFLHKPNKKIKDQKLLRPQ